ncbi:MAG: DUF5060 domain-containing protein [Kiritimatiellae bacterium]|nr:DUF5060 domain-containing protein [Kiritimatiellia bacterium]
MVDLYDGWPHNKGDAEVDLLSTPPFNVAAPINLNGQDLTISVFCPTGARGDDANPNRIQIYAKDNSGSWHALYTEETDIEEGRWMTFTLPISTNAPSGGWIDEGFDPQAVRAIGVRLTHGGSGSDYEGPIFIDAATFPVPGRTLYGFREDGQGWTNENWGFGSAEISWTNTVGTPNAGAIVVTPQQGSGYGKFYVKDWDQVENETLVWAPILQAYIWVPCDAPANYHHAVRARLVLRSSVDGWSYDYMGEEQVLMPCSWNLVRWDMSALPVEILNEADEYGMELVWGNRDVWQGPVMIDSISAIAREPDAAPAITSVTPLSGSAGRYEKYEVTVGLDHVSGLNPYDPNMVDLQATFVSPSGQVWNICGFYMEEDNEPIGQGSWRIRFAPDEIGTWTYDVTVENGMGADSSTGHTFSCVGSDHHGPIRVSDDDGHYFEYADDTPFVGIGYCHPWDGGDEGIFANCAEHGINMIHCWMAPWDTLLTVKPANPTDFWREKSTYDTYEQGRAAELDRVVGHAEKYGVKLVFTIWPHDAIRDFNHHKWRINGSWAKAFDQKFSEPEWYINAFSELDDPPMNQKFFYDDVYLEYQDRLYRYIIARWGYSEAIGTWALASELFGTYANSANCIEYQDPLWVTNKNALLGEDPYEHMDTNQCDGADYTISWLTYIHTYFADNDPFGHPTTASYGTDEYWEHGFPVIDVPQIHTYADLYNWITPPVTVAKYHHYLREHYDKPSFMGEIGTVEWKTFEPDYTRVTMWPGICSGGAITPMMWTTPAFSWFGDAKMGPWLDIMSDEAKVLAQFISDIDFHHLDLRPAEVVTLADGEPAVTMVESFESGINSWSRWGNGSTNMTLSTNHVTDGTQCLRLDVNMDSYDNMPDPATGIEKYEGDGFSYDWSAYWPNGTLKMDVYVPEFYHPDTNPDGYLLGINKDPRSILEVFTKDEGGGWHWYSTTNEYGDALRESGGWKKMTVGMLWNLELPLGNITSAYEAAHISGFKFKFGDVGIQRGPVYIDNMTAGRYAFNTFGMVGSNGQFAFAWIQDRTWSDDVVASNATFQINDLAPGTFYVEWWSTLHGALGACNANAPTGTLSVTVPDFSKDIAVKIRRVGDIGLTIHDVAVTGVREYDWVIQGQKWPVEIKVANQGTASETFNVTLTDLTDGRGIGTNVVTLGGGEFTNTVFFWNNAGGSVSNVHTLMAQASTVAGETDTDDNQLAGLVRVYAENPPWDTCSRLRRWAVDANDSDARTLRVQTNSAYVSEGDSSFEVYHRSPDKQQAYIGFDQVYEDWSNKTALVCDIYIADGATNAQLLMRTGENWTWHYSADYALSSGWNRDVTFDFTASEWTRVEWNDLTQQNDYYYDVLPDGLEQMQQIFLKLSGYPSDGHFYVDNIRLSGEYLVHLAYVNGDDFFPRAVAEQTNYTGAACCWMIARYLNGDSFNETQADIYSTNVTDPVHNDEITPQSCASWMPKNTPPGYYFSARNSATLTDAVKEVVYWIDYVPSGGLKSPVYILCNTSWSYKVVRGFKTDRKPYDGGSGVQATNQFNVYGLWLNDPMVRGLGYNLYAAAQEIGSIYLPSLTNGSYWMVAEPPADAEERASLEASMDQTGLVLIPPHPNEAVAEFLAETCSGASRMQGASSGAPGLNEILPSELAGDSGFMAAFDAAPVIRCYAVNTNRSDSYYLVAGGERGPRSTRYILKLGPDGALLQATWEMQSQYYEPVALAVADWSARRSLSGESVVLASSERISLPGGSDFHPVWNLEYEVDGTNVSSMVQQNVDLSGDSDGDGASDGDEWYAGTDPDSGLSVFSVTGGGVQTLSPERLVLTWPSVGGKTYSIYRAERMDAAFTRIACGLSATPCVNTYTDSVFGVSAFYRIEVE